MQFDDDQHNESEISDKDDVGAGSSECVVDERVEVDNDEGPEICEQTDNKSKLLKWTRFFKATKEEVSNNYIVIQQKRKKKNNNDVVVKTIVTVYRLVLLNFCVCMCDHALATSRICLNE